MNAQFWLSILFLGIVVAIHIWDVTMMATARPEDTVSALVRDWSNKQPILAFAVGVLMGHVFW